MKILFELKYSYLFLYKFSFKQHLYVFIQSLICILVIYGKHKASMLNFAGCMPWETASWKTKKMWECILLESIEIVVFGWVVDSTHLG